MKLLTKELRATIPPLYANEPKSGVEPVDPVVHVKFFTPWTNWTWYATEGLAEGDDFIFFGFVVGLENEWGYFSLNELESITGPAGLKIERDLYFKPGPSRVVVPQLRERK